jgi:hypothetical protein
MCVDFLVTSRKSVELVSMQQVRAVSVNGCWMIRPGTSLSCLGKLAGLQDVMAKDHGRMPGAAVVADEWGGLEEAVEVVLVGWNWQLKTTRGRRQMLV